MSSGNTHVLNTDPLVTSFPVIASFEKSMMPLRQAYRMDETQAVETILQEANLPKENIKNIQQRSREWMINIRKNRLQTGGLDAFLYQYDLSSEEGIALMCLAEALLRIPDSDTMDRLIRDKIASQDWEDHLGKSPSWFVNAATFGLMLTGKVLTEEEQNPNTLLKSLKRLVSRAGEPIIREAVKSAMKILGNQFVMGHTITAALKRSKKWEEKGYRYSYDMLGEAAKTEQDALHYFNAYVEAIEEIGKSSKKRGPIEGPGVSVKLSALHPRYEWVNKERIIKELLPKLEELAFLAMKYDIHLTIDAEEADRLELSLLLLTLLLQNKSFRQWQGLGLAVQAYQKRAVFVIDWLQDLAENLQQPLMIRLVKGAYWDSEIKWSQERGLFGYPVFTRKTATDVSYLVCAKKLFQGTSLLFPQFATHNAYTAAAVLEMANLYNRHAFEFQCLHGMGDALYSNIVGQDKLNLPCRIYAPVGSHEYLLGYLVRRLLENGANTSFVNRIIDEKTPIESLIQDPTEKLIAIHPKPHPEIPIPLHLYEPDRLNSKGVDITNPNEIEPLLEEAKTFWPSLLEKPLFSMNEKDMTEIANQTQKCANDYTAISPLERAKWLDNMAELLETHKKTLLALLVREASKSVLDSLSEIREAVDFARYYSFRLKKDFVSKRLKGPTGEYNQLSLHGRGMVACISPWNFPLAIFSGQVMAALAAGNTVIAKPASQTPRIAEETIRLLHEAGFPKEVVRGIYGKGSLFGNVLLKHPGLQGVMFTGSTDTARTINIDLANREGPLVPFIAETGGQNAMIVDSSALPEQVISDVITSSFNSAGQRCSALRVLFVQEDIADRIITMLQGAMAELKIGDPFLLSVDVGPLIDKGARETLEKHHERMMKEAKLVYQCAMPKDLPDLPHGAFFAPRAFEISNIKVLTEEVFGPILHIIRFSGRDLDKVIEAVNNTGYGLTLGIHSRVKNTIDYIAARMKVGNMYVNRNMIGAVVGVQPFGGEGLSGTGPKAGGPHILPRLAVERTLSVNIAATGGNTDLLSLSE